MEQQIAYSALVAVEAKIVDALGFDQVFSLNDMRVAAEQAGLLREYDDAIVASK